MAAGEPDRAVTALPDVSAETPPKVVPPADPTPSIGMSRRHLRAQLVQRAAVLASRARAARRRGELHHARLLQQRAEQMQNVVRSMDED